MVACGFAAPNLRVTGGSAFTNSLRPSVLVIVAICACAAPQKSSSAAKIVLAGSVMRLCIDRHLGEGHRKTKTFAQREIKCHSERSEEPASCELHPQNRPERPSPKYTHPQQFSKNPPAERTPAGRAF